MPPLRPLLLAVLLLALAGPGCDESALHVRLVGDSHSDVWRTPRADWIPWMPAQWTFDGRLAKAGNLCRESVGGFLAGPDEPAGDVVVIFCGSNDVGAGDFNLAASAVWIGQAIGAAQAAGAVVVVVTPPPAFETGGEPPEVRNARLAELREAILGLAALSGAEVADLWAETWAHEDPPSLYADGLHFGYLGRVMMSQVIHAAVVEARQ